MSLDNLQGKYIQNNCKILWSTQNFQESNTCTNLRAIPFFLVEVLTYVFLNLQHKWVFIAAKGIAWTTEIARKYPWLKDDLHQTWQGNIIHWMSCRRRLWKGIISYLQVHTGARLDTGEKRIIFRSVTFQNLVQNSCNARLVTHLRVDLTWNLESER
jgi:hypothetical protein